MYEAMQVNAAVEAGLMYVAANGWPSNTSLLTNAEAAAIQPLPQGSTPAGTTFPPAILPSNVPPGTPIPAQFCGCPSATGISPVACSVTCPGGAPHGTYGRVGAQLSHLTLLPTSFGIPPNLTAIAVIRIN